MNEHRIEYEMTEKDLDKLLEQCKPTPYMVVGGFTPRTPQENANAAWGILGEKMGLWPDIYDVKVY